MIIFTSDNGSRARDEGGSNAPCRGTKATTWEGGQRVPCIMHWPGRLASGGVCKEVMRAMDLFPTLTQLAGAEPLPERPIDGVDCSAYLLGETTEFPNETFYYYMGAVLEAVRVGDWKLHLAKGKWGTDPGPTPMRELYHLRDDMADMPTMSG